MIYKIGIVTDTHWTTQARQDAIGANRWPVWMNGLTPWHFAAVEAKAAKANTTFATQSVDAIVHLGDLYTPQGAVVDYAAVHPLFTVEGKHRLYSDCRYTKDKQWSPTICDPNEICLTCVARRVREE